MEYIGFNAAAALSNRTNMNVLLENMDLANKNPYAYRSTFLRSVDSLDKERHFYLLNEVYSILLRFVNVSMAYDVLTAIDGEMAELQAFLPARNGGKPIPPPSAAVL